ncbi:MAG: hypothetical protein ACRD0U_06385, partial [Acidimicrobiales bacterium]
MPDGASVETMVVAFARVLRGAGLDVPVGSTLAFAEALGELGVERRADVYWGGRATLVRRPEDVPLYDRAFAVFWRGAVAHEELSGPPPVVTIALDDGDSGSPGEGAAADRHGPVLQVRYSPHEVLRNKDFAVLSRAELDEARR